MNHRNDETGTRLCSICEKPTAHATLAQYGARCYFCFQAYCAQGINGGPAGFMGGAADTPDQAIMRKAMKANRPIGQDMTRDASAEAVIIADAEQRKRQTDRRVAEYERNHR